MTHNSDSKERPINIVGAGIFGLSTALHLARRGYTHVTVFDKQPYDQTRYSYFNGSDAASADINKILRSGYGGETVYQDLTVNSIEGWKQWNEDLASGKDLPPGLSSHDRVFVNNGHLVLTDQDTLPPFELATVTNMQSAGHGDTQLLIHDPKDQCLAAERGLAYAIDPFQRKRRLKSNVGILDTTGGYLVADKACLLALHKARRQGVRFLFGPAAGAFDSIIYKSDSRSKAIGIKTMDGKVHPADMNIIACGGWTPSLLPELDGLCETTAGSVVIFKIPKQSSLYDRLSPERFPSWQWKMRDGADGGLYGFPRDENGLFKIGYRGTKYTNPVRQPDGRKRSVPTTRWSSGNVEDDGQRISGIPQQALRVIQSFMAEHLPELVEEGISMYCDRLCWYNDSFDNHLVIDRVPKTEGLMVATGGSGHAFKYLPSIGDWVVDIMECVGMERKAVQAWRWRQQRNKDTVNVLMEGSKGRRALGNIVLLSNTGVPNRSKL